MFRAILRGMPIPLFAILSVGLVECNRNTASGPEGSEIRVQTRWTGAGNKVKEEYQYYIDSPTGRQIKHGFYRRFFTTGNLWEEGTYSHGRKTGEWCEYLSGSRVCSIF